MEAQRVNAYLIGKKYHEIVDKLNIVEYQGDCCGYASCKVTAALPEGLDLASLVLKDCVQLNYNPVEEDRQVLNFVFKTTDGNEVILGYELSAGSGSGWSYGAYVQLKHNDVILCEASY